MSNITNFSEGASILQQVDVSDIFKNLALGIAEAQQKLDDNSVAQVIRLSQTQINGVSLLQLGFAPVFYAFQYADISASINLKMAMKESLEFGFGIDLKLSNQKGYTSSDQQFLSKDSYSETKEEYKTSRQLSFRANESKDIQIDSQFFRQRTDQAAKTRLETFKEDIINRSSVEQIYEEIETKRLTNNQSRGIDVWIDGGFLRIEKGASYEKTAVGILKIADSGTNTSIDVDGPDSEVAFQISPSFTTNLDNSLTANTGTVYGISKSGDFYKYSGSGWDKIPSSIYFKFNKDVIDYTDNLFYTGHDGTHLNHPSPIPGSYQDKNHNEHLLIHQLLRMIQSHDSSSVITITGYTDPVGGNGSGNKSLAKRRAENVRNHIFGTTAPINVTISSSTNNPGSSDLLERRADIKLDADYIIFLDGHITTAATPEVTASDKNKFVYLDGSTPNPFNTLSVTYGSIELHYYNVSNFETMLENVKTTINKVSFESINERHYYLSDEAIVKFNMYTNESEEISIDQHDEESSSESSSENTFLSSQTRNKQSELNNAISNNSQSNSFALGANVDFRMAKQFEMSMEGNASMSARLVAVPAPEAFTEFIQNTYNPQQSGQ